MCCAIYFPVLIKVVLHAYVQAGVQMCAPAFRSTGLSTFRLARINAERQAFLYMCRTVLCHMCETVRYEA